MKLSREAYRALEAIVGPENISTDPAVLDTYIYQWLGEKMGELGNKFTPFRPIAVVCPGSTEEVQAIVKVCNRFGLKFKAIGTGWGPLGVPGGEGVIQLDLRRMNRILEINEEDMYAVVEPYVNYAQLQAEAWKRGLNCNTIGAGSSCSVIADTLAQNGIGPNNIFMGFPNRHALAIEWVLPNGEILRLGSLGQGAGWISGDGPGPSLRGIVRGWVGSRGGFGVFTKAAIRLYHWPGPPELKIEGIRPFKQRLLNPPTNFASYSIPCKTLEQRNEAWRKIGEAEIGYTQMFTGGGFALIFALLSYFRSESEEELKEIHKSLAAILPESFIDISIWGFSEREFAYQKKLGIEKDATSGMAAATPQARDTLTIMALRLGNIPAACFQLCGSFVPVMMDNISPGYRPLIEAERISSEIKRKFIAKGTILDDGGNGCWGTGIDFGHLAYVENECFYRPFDREIARSMLELHDEVNKALAERKIIIPFSSQIFADMLRHKEAHETLGPQMHNYHEWMRKIKRAFDPNNTSDPTTHIST